MRAQAAHQTARGALATFVEELEGKVSTTEDELKRCGDEEDRVRRLRQATQAEREVGRSVGRSV